MNGAFVVGSVDDSAFGQHWRSLPDSGLGELPEHERVSLLGLAPIAMFACPISPVTAASLGRAATIRNDASDRRKSCETRTSSCPA
jgi:hypothetical protein